MHVEAIKVIFLKKQLDEFLPVLFAAEWRFDVEDGTHFGCDL